MWNEKEILLMKHSSNKPTTPWYYINTSYFSRYDSNGLYNKISQPQMVDLSFYDYLGFSTGIKKG